MSDKDNGQRELDKQRYYRAAHRVQSAIAFNPVRPRDEYKDLRTGLDLSKSDQGGLVTLLIQKGVFTMEEYLNAIAVSAEQEALSKEDELSAIIGVNVKTL